MAITGVGWELELVRLGQHQGWRLITTSGSYAVHVDGQRVDRLNGFMVQCQGPGENDRVCDQDYRRRIRDDTYSLYTHDTHYASIGYPHTATRRPTGTGCGVRPGAQAKRRPQRHPSPPGARWRAILGKHRLPEPHGSVRATR
jgi:hypothetical protein